MTFSHYGYDNRERQSLQQGILFAFMKSLFPSYSHLEYLSILMWPFHIPVAVVWWWFVFFLFKGHMLQSIVLNNILPHTDKSIIAQRCYCTLVRAAKAGEHQVIFNIKTKNIKIYLMYKWYTEILQHKRHRLFQKCLLCLLTIGMLHLNAVFHIPLKHKTRNVIFMLFIFIHLMHFDAFIQCSLK